MYKLDIFRKASKPIFFYQRAATFLNVLKSLVVSLYEKKQQHDFAVVAYSNIQKVTNLINFFLPFIGEVA